MKDQYFTPASPVVDDSPQSQNPHKHLPFLQKSHSTSNDGDYVSRLPRLSRSRSTSSNSSANNNKIFSRLPTFRRSPTSSTTSSAEAEVCKLDVPNSVPVSKMQRESVEVGVGGFSKPRLGRRDRRKSEGQQQQKEKEFRYYGRHANSWLFNDVSVTGFVRKGFGKVFSGSKE